MMCIDQSRELCGGNNPSYSAHYFCDSMYKDNPSAVQGSSNSLRPQHNRPRHTKYHHLLPEPCSAAGTVAG